jgi:hypothetical protein
MLLQVCNHPDLFEGRPIVSAFDFPGLSLQYPSCVMSGECCGQYMCGQYKCVVWGRVLQALHIVCHVWAVTAVPLLCHVG